MIEDFGQALVREIPRCYASAYLPMGRQISVELADAQHRAYVSALRSAGLTVSAVSADERYFDCVFIEDTAIVWRDQALITRMTEHREGEQAGVEAVLRRAHHIHRLRPGAKLEGGDVLHVDDTTYVGITGRTNEAGIAGLRAFLEPLGQRVVATPSPNCFHLKSGVTFLGDQTLLCVPGWFDMSLFSGLDVIHTADGESGAANALRVGDHLLILDGFPRTEELIRRFAEQNKVILKVLNASEFQKGDGSLTCLSLIW